MTPPGAAATEPVLDVRGLVKHFAVPRTHGGGLVHAVDGVDLRIGAGEVLGLVGESGSGKSTVGKCIVRLLEPTEGTIRLHGKDISHMSRRRFRAARRDVHMVFQDPYSSLNPRLPVDALISEPLRMHRVASGPGLDKRVDELLDQVGLARDLRYRYPHELSGGQRQRIGLARSLSLRPSLLIADEPVSALDVSVQASILNLLLDLQRDMGFSCLFIAHDLGTVEFFCNTVAVMYLGKIVEQAPRAELFRAPKHPYTQSLLSAAVLPDPVLQRSRKRVVLQGDVPSPIHPPTGCSFHTRCPVAELPLCREQAPLLAEVAGARHRASCHLISRNGDAPQVTAAAKTEVNKKAEL
ncbi:MAG: ABC transporter ATP-binding protein [Sciscionella sp.]